MELFLLRHGAAESTANSDPERALTSRGREEVNWVLASAKQQLQRVDLIAVSPYLRAQQTAQIVLSYLSTPAGVTQCKANFLTPDSDPKYLYQWLAEQNHNCIVMVTHQPLIGGFLDELCGLNRGHYQMGTGALAYIKMDAIGIGLGELQWLRQT